MAIENYHQPEMPVPVPQRRCLEEGPLVVEYSVMPLSPSLWIAHAEVVRGIPEDTFRMQHPRFSGVGVTEIEAVRALIRELEQYLDDPYWESMSCH